MNKTPDHKMNFLTDDIPTNSPIGFMEHLTPSDKLIHKGIFNPDLSEYYYTLSDKGFQQFDVYVIRKTKNKWSTPEKAAFNSNFSEHGMSFSPDGNAIYFSSTRPTKIEGTPETWHIWKSAKINGKWNAPIYVDIPNLTNKLISHPIITDSGNLYFHSSNLDYSEMDIYYSISENGQFGPAIKASISPIKADFQKCTPYVSPKEDYMLFASIGKELDLMVAFNDGQGKWIGNRKLNKEINNKGQGNPYITPKGKFLFFTSGNSNGEDWKVKWVNIEDELVNE